MKVGELAGQLISQVGVFAAEEALVHHQDDEPVRDGPGGVAEPGELVAQDQEP